MRASVAFCLGFGTCAVVALALLYGGGEPVRETHALASEPERDLPNLREALRQIDLRLGHIEATTSAQGDPSERKPEAADPLTASASASEPGPKSLDADSLHRDLDLLEKRIDALTAAVKEGFPPVFQSPTLEQLHAARKDTDWAFVDDLRLRWLSDPVAALERVRGMSFDDLLGKVGLPTSITPAMGKWFYYRWRPDEHGQSLPCGVTFTFIGDHVSDFFATQ